MVFVNFDLAASVEQFHATYQKPFEANMALNGFDDDKLVWVRDLKFHYDCNWKVLQDNNIDGGYHIPYVHKTLASNIQLDTYETEFTEDYCMQTAKGKGSDARVGSAILYTAVYPATNINCYGPFVELNLIYPKTAKTCEIIFEYYLRKDFVDGKTKEEVDKYIQESLDSSYSVQEEDLNICNAVQTGLQSSGYVAGRYSPKIEASNYAFHSKLAKQYLEYTNGQI